MWRSLISRYLTWKLRQKAPRSQRASGRRLGLGAMQDVGVDEALVRGQRPLAHLGVRAGREVDPPDRRVRVQPGGRRDRRQPVGVRLEGLEEPLDPPTLAPAVLPGRRPCAELLAVVAHHPDPLAVLGGVLAQVADDVVDLAERDPVAKALLGPEDAQQVTLVLGRVRAPQVVLGDRGGPEVRVVEDRPVVAGATSEVGRSGSQTRSASHAPRGRRPISASSSSLIRRSWPIRSRSGSEARTGS